MASPFLLEEVWLFGLTWVPGARAQASGRSVFPEVRARGGMRDPESGAGAVRGRGLVKTDDAKP
jgi:hypothetical protein